MRGFRVIRDASYIVWSLCGEQEFYPTRPYRLSDFVFTYKMENSILYYSCLTGELLEVIDINAACKYLVNHWFLVEEGYNEKENAPKLRKLMQAIEENKKTGYNHFEILTTTNCNANCSYCYENGFRHMSMNEDTAMRVVSYIGKNLWGAEAKIRWYGGEPLMNMAAIDWISNGLSNHSIPFSSKMISNGYHFSDKTVLKAKNTWKLKNVRITLDGTEQTHNKIKQFKNADRSPFLRILDNIGRLLNAGISVTIRINVESHNIDEIQDVINQVCNKYGKDERLDFMIRPLSNTNKLMTIESQGSLRKLVYNRVNEMKTYLFENGYQVNTREIVGMSPHSCAADNRRYLLIKPDGGLAFCPEDFDMKQYGTINDDSECVRPYSYFKYNFDKGIICDNCPLYISCYPNRECPASKKTICDPAQKDSILKDLELSIRKEYQKFIKTNKHEIAEYL